MAIDYIILEDRRLVELSLAGDTAAFENLFNRYRNPILSYIRHTGADIDFAEDLLQDTFVKVFLNLHSYKPQYTFSQWIMAIARNTSIDHLRRQHDNVQIDTAGGSFAVSPPSPLPNPEETVIREQTRRQIDRYLREIDPNYRECFELRFFGEYSYEEIAKRLGKPLGTVKTNIHRARQQLCRLISERSDLLK